MIQCPAGWREWRAGDVFMYAPREGRISAVMTYEECVAPLRSLAVLVAEVLADDSQFEPEEQLPVKRFLTDESEYGARTIVKGRHQGRAIAHVVSAVFGDEFSTRLTARVELDYLERHVEMVDAMAQRDRLALGVRRRRVLFTPPRDWHPVAGVGLEMLLYAPEYPKKDAVITVYPAEPQPFALDPHGRQQEDDERAGITFVEAGAPRVVTGTDALGSVLDGHEWSSRRALSGGGNVIRRLAVLRDSRYVYAAKLEMGEHDDSDELQRTFAALMASMQVVPSPKQQSTAAAAVAMWTE